MTAAEFDKLKSELKAYKAMKDAIANSLRIPEVKEEVRAGKRYVWHLSELQNQLYRELEATPERKAYIEAYRKLDDADFEENFRKIAIEIGLY